MQLLKGKKIADKILSEIKTDIKKKKLKPVLAVVLIGGDKASKIYVSLKKKAAEKVGIKFELIKFSDKYSEKKIIQKIKFLNADKRVSGIIVQLPLSGNFHTQKIINAIDPRKDVDGFHPKNLKLFLASRSNIFPVFPKAIVKILESVETRFIASKKQAIVIANSDKFGKIMTAALKNKKISGKYILASGLKKNIKIVQSADIIITAVGKPGLVKGKMIKAGAIIIDGGITKVGKKVLGDVDFESVKNIASYITPVPGGVGPVTIACLLENVYLAAKKSSA